MVDAFQFISVRFLRSVPTPSASLVARLSCCQPSRPRDREFACGATSPGKPTAALSDLRPTALPKDTVAPFADVGS